MLLSLFVVTRLLWKHGGVNKWTIQTDHFGLTRRFVWL
nr:MAG TPA: hypothetical protein [Caudoviricetes sp.]